MQCYDHTKHRHASPKKHTITLQVVASLAARVVCYFGKLFRAAAEPFMDGCISLKHLLEQ